jgi:hypothetical protein
VLVPVPVVLGGPAMDNGRRVMVDRGGRGRSAVMAVDELVMEVCDGGRSVVTLERLVTDDLARMCRMPGPGPASGVLVPETARREAGTPEEVVGLTPAVVTDPGVRVEVVDGWRMEDARVRRPGGDVSGAGLLSFSRWRAAAEVMRAKTPESGRLPLVAELVVALLARRVWLWPGPTGSLLGEALRLGSPPLAVSDLVGLRSERVRDRALAGAVDDIVASLCSGNAMGIRVHRFVYLAFFRGCRVASPVVLLICGCDWP